MSTMTSFQLFDGLTLPATADMHVHLREGPMMETVTPTIRQGGVDTVFVMPNLVPPITTVKHCLDYRARLQNLAPDVHFLMSLYLHPDITPDTIREAKRAGCIYGVKSYPAGVTTNSAAGVVDYVSFYPVFEAMEQEGLVLNLHGEAPPAEDITVLNAEEAFLPTLMDLHRRFPKLRVILEHCTTAAAVDAVRKCGPTVSGTITAHHLFLIVDDWAGDPINFCKPVAKLPSDRLALLRAAMSGESKFFLGTDSAPHALASKKGIVNMAADGHGGKCAAGVFTQPFATQFVLEAFEAAVQKGLVPKETVNEKMLRGFLGEFGRAFYGIAESKQKIRITATKSSVVSSLTLTTATESGQIQDKVVTFRHGKPVYNLEWL